MSPRTAAALRGDDTSLRDHLIEAARRLVAERGTAGLTVRDIAREARVADGVLYNHFAGKEELLALGLDAHVRAADSGRPAPEPGSGSVEANLRVLVRRGFALHAATVPAFAGLLSQPKVLSAYASLPKASVPLREVLADYLRSEQELGRLAAFADVPAAVTLISGAWHDRVLRGLLSGDVPGATEPDDRLVDSLVATVLRGIARH
ncbi:TetR/AcrR family transcriptional regulator [Rhodococcus gannanensis]|uniref:TetR/AcrR family transcriptional regulator n=1 Tax=Rhodococcus gannanensis TaxID=1960308 RepID=A0ABW4P8X9_9NOCA